MRNIRFTNIKILPLVTCLVAILFFNACTQLQQATPNVPWGTSQTTTETPTHPPIVPPAIQTPFINEFSNLPPVKVAILLPLSGPKSALGQSMLQGAQMSLFEMGYTNFNLMPRDTGGTQNGAAAAATSAVNDGAQLILGPLFADSVRAVKPIARSKNINVIAFSTDWSLADNSTFLMGFMPFTQVERVARYALSKGFKDYALIAPQDTYGNAVSGKFSETILQNGGALARSIRYDSADTAIRNQIESLNSADFNAVFMPVGGSQTDLIASTLSYNNLLPHQVKRLGTGLWDDPNIARQPNMDGGWFAAPSPSKRYHFEQKYTQSFGQPPARLATLAYDATALAAILAKNGYQRRNAPDYNFDAITNTNGFAGTDGVFRFKKNGLIERSLAILEIRNGSIVEIDRAPTRF